MTIPDEAVQAAHAEYHKVLGDSNRSNPMLAAITAALPFLQGVKVESIDTAPKNGDEFLARCGKDWPWFSCFWDGSAFVHYDHVEGIIGYPATEWIPLPDAHILSAIEAFGNSEQLAPSRRAQALEEAARAICITYGQDPDDYASICDICGPNNEPRPQWHLYIEQAEAAIRALSSQPMAARSSDLEQFWRPISEADKSITFNQDFDLGGSEKMTIRNSDEYWVRDDDGRVYRALWSDHKGGYWWDIDGESPVDPVEYMPHPLSLPASPGASE